MSDVATATAPAYLKACCADLWSHPGVRLLCGEALRPGGADLTSHAIDLLQLKEGARVLDVGSGPGTTLGLLAQRGLRPVGADYSVSLASESATVAPSVAADAERQPFPSGSMDAVFMECVLSAVPDKIAALFELARVLRPGGSLVLSDVVVEEALPAPLDSFAGWIACAAGALPARGYADLLERAGFAVETQEDHRPAMAGLLAQVGRRLALIRGAVRAGLMDGSSAGLDEGVLDLGEHLLRVAREAVDAGALGYRLYVARRQA
ncbi:MAG: DVU_1556 family methyltransferase [Actinomycetota bacterium]